MVRDGRFWCRIGVSARFAGLVADTLDLLAAQQIPARYERIGQRAGYEQAMSALLKPRSRTLAKPNTRLMTPNECSTPRFREGRLLARTLGLVRFFARSTSSTTARWRLSDDRAGGHLRSLRRQMPLRLVEQLPAQRLLHRFLSDPIAEAIANGARGAGFKASRSPRISPTC